MNKDRTMARDYGPPPGDSSLGFVVWHGKRNDRSMKSIAALTNAELAWAGRILAAEIGRRKGEIKVAGSAKSW